MNSDNSIPAGLYDTIYAKGQRDALQAVRRAIDNVEIERGARVPRALKEAIKAQLEALPAIHDDAQAGLSS